MADFGLFNQESAVLGETTNLPAKSEETAKEMKDNSEVPNAISPKKEPVVSAR